MSSVTNSSEDKQHTPSRTITSSLIMHALQTISSSAKSFLFLAAVGECLLYVTQMLREAVRTSPSIVYLPHVSDWWHVTTEAVRAGFVSAFNDVDPSVPVLLLATSDVEYKRLSPQVSCVCVVNTCCL